MNGPDSHRLRRSATERERRLEALGGMLSEALIEIEDEEEARRVIAALVPEGRPMFRYMLRCWREGRVIF